MSDAEAATGAAGDGGREADAGLAEDARALYDQAPFGYVSSTMDWTIFRVNRTLLDLLGLSEEQVVGRRLPDLLAPGDRIYHETHYAPLFRLQGVVREVAADMVGADGHRHPVLLGSDVVLDERTGESFIRTGVVDISDRQRYEEELLRQRRRAEASEARERTLKEAVAELAAAVTPDDVAEVVADVARRVIGDGEVAVWLLAPDGETLVPHGATQQATGLDVEGDELEVRALRADGVVAGPEGTIAVPLGAGTRPLGVLVVRDASPAAPPDEQVTDLLLSLGQQSGQALERAQLYEDKDRMLGMVAHDLRTPLATIEGFAQTLQRFLGEDLEPAAAQSLERIVSTTERLTRLTDDLLDTSVLRLGRFALDRASVPVGPVVMRAAGAHRPAAEEKDIALQLRDRSSDARALVDVDRLVQVVDNLVSNALKYSPPGRPVAVTVTAEARRIRVAVADRGPGIPPDEMAGLFAAFGRTANRPTGGESSTGLGLAIAKGIVEAHGGEVEVDSEPGAGSTFAFWVPRDATDTATDDDA